MRKRNAAENSDTTKYRSACTAFVQEIARIVAITATADATRNSSVTFSPPRCDSWQEALHVDGRGLVLRLALLLAADLETRHAVEVVAGVLAGTADEQVFLLVHE